MHLVVDGYVYEWQRRGGVSRIFTETLPRICDYEPSLLIDLVTENALLQDLPVHPHINHRKIPCADNFLRPRRLWRGAMPAAQRFLRKAYLGKGRGRIWHSTYYTEPEMWKGKRAVTVADLLHQRFPKLFNTPSDQRHCDQMRHCIKNADRLLTISDATRADVQELYGIDDLQKLRVVRLACGSAFRVLKEDERSSGEIRAKPFLLYVGDRNHYKNFATLVEAFGIWSHRKDVDLLVVGGTNWSRSEVAQLERLGLTAEVKRLPSVDDEQLVRLYNTALAFVYPSLYEGFGIPLLEALSCGCLIIASRIPSTLEVAADCPIYFEADQVDSLIVAFEEALLESSNDARRAKGFSQARKYSWDKAARETLAIYRELDVEMGAG